MPALTFEKILSANFDDSLFKVTNDNSGADL